jgi:hypothetical protein
MRTRSPTLPGVNPIVARPCLDEGIALVVAFGSLACCDVRSGARLCQVKTREAVWSRDVCWVPNDSTPRRAAGRGRQGGRRATKAAGSRAYPWGRCP